MARRRNLDTSKAAPFTPEAGKVPFANPRNLLVAQDWMEANGASARDGVFIVDLYGRWQHKANEVFTKRRLMKDYRLGAATLELVVRGVQELAGLHCQEVFTKTGKPKGFFLSRKPCTTEDLPAHSLSTTSGIACQPSSALSQKQGAFNQKQGALSQKHQVLSAGSTTKTSTKTFNEDLSIKPMELSAERCSTPSPIRTEKGRMVRAAIRMWDEQQSAFGGLCSDAQSEEVIIAALQGSTDAEAAEYLGTGLARGWSYWSLDKPCPYGAGQLTAAVNQGWSELEHDKQSPDASSCLPWISELGEFDPGDHAYGCFPHEQEPVFAPAEAPAALDKGKTPSETVEAALDAPRALSETSVADVSLPAAVQQPSPTPSVPSQPKAETRKTSLGMDSAQIERAKQKALASFKQAQQQALTNRLQALGI